MNENNQSKDKEELEVLDEQTGQVKLKIPPEFVGHIIGKNGQHIKKLREQTNTNLSIQWIGASYEDGQVLKVSGYPKNVENAKKIIYEFIAKKKNEMSSCLGTTMVESWRYVLLGKCALHLKKYDEAMSFFDKALETCPKENIFVWARILRARTAFYEVLGNYSAAVEDCSKALELVPNSVDAQLKMVHALEHQNRLKSALSLALNAFADSCLSAGLMAERILQRLEEKGVPVNNFNDQKKRLAQLKQDRVIIKFKVPNDEYNLVLRPVRIPLNEISKQTGASCELDRSTFDDDEKEKTLLIQGNKKQIEHAKELLNKKIKIGLENKNSKKITLKLFSMEPYIYFHWERVYDCAVKWENYFKSHELVEEAKGITNALKEMKNKRSELNEPLYPSEYCKIFGFESSMGRLEYVRMWMAYPGSSRHEKNKELEIIEAFIKSAKEHNETSMLDPVYQNALIDKAKVLKENDNPEGALEVALAACILGKFTNSSSLTIVDRVLEQLAEKSAEEFLQDRKPVLPSKHFIKNYLNSFTSDPVLSMSSKELIKAKNKCFARAWNALKDEKYENILDICREEMEKYGDKNTINNMKFILLRGTFQYLVGQHEKALEDFNFIIKNENSSDDVTINALIKRGMISLQSNEPEKCFNDFSLAVKINPDCEDIYHHRSQAYLSMDRVQEAQEDATQALALNSKRAFAFAHKYYADYRLAVTKKSEEMIEAAKINLRLGLEQFPDCCECCTMYAQTCCDSESYDYVEEFFGKAIEIDPKNADCYVSIALLLIHRGRNLEKPIKFIEKALEIDEKCKSALEALALIELYQGNLLNSIDYFKKILPLTTTRGEAVNVFRHQHLVKAQLNMEKKLGYQVKGLHSGFGRTGFISMIYKAIGNK